MNFNFVKLKNHLSEATLMVTFVPFFFKTLDYATLGSFVPLLLSILFLSVFFLGQFKWPHFVPKIIKAWGISIILWSVARFTIMTLFLTTSVQEAHIDNQFTSGFVILNLMYLVCGFFLIANKQSTKQF